MNHPIMTKNKKSKKGEEQLIRSSKTKNNFTRSALDLFGFYPIHVPFLANTIFTSKKINAKFKLSVSPKPYNFINYILLGDVLNKTHSKLTIAVHTKYNSQQ